MLVWLLFALMTFAAVMCVVWPLSRPRPAALLTAGDDLPFYRDQLRALDRDVKDGLVAAEDVAGSRAEIGRRLIAAADRSVSPSPPGDRRRRLFGVALAVTVAIPTVSLLLYKRIGMPDLPDQPLAARLAHVVPDDVAAAVARIEAHLAKDPSDGRGFALLAPIYMRLGRYDDAARGFSRALALLGESAEYRAAYGEALMNAAGGTITPEAEAAFARAVADDPKLPQARYFLGAAAAARGDGVQARAIWTALVAEAEPDAPWVPMVKARLAALGDGASPGAADAIGPSSPAGAEIVALPAADRLQAIRGMVDGLAARLQADGRDADGWLKLVRSYVVLGDKEKAQAALRDARRLLGDDAAASGRLDALSRELGLEPRG